eukprot:1444782-Karenia_brevis.AAC.1
MARLLAFDGPIMHSDHVRSCHVLRWINPVQYVAHVAHVCQVKDYVSNRSVTIHVHIPNSMYEFVQ